MKRNLIVACLLTLITAPNLAWGAPTSTNPTVSFPISGTRFKTPQSENCWTAYFKLVGSYVGANECKTPDQAFANKYAEILCLCKEFTSNNPYTQGFFALPACNQKLAACKELIAPAALSHIQSCLTAPPLESLGCRLIDPDDAEAPGSGQAIQETKEACFP